MHSGPSMLRTRNISAYRDLLVLFTKYGRKDFRLALQPEDLLVADRGDGDGAGRQGAKLKGR